MKTNMIIFNGSEADINVVYSCDMKRGDTGIILEDKHFGGSPIISTSGGVIRLSGSNAGFILQDKYKVRLVNFTLTVA